MITREEDYLLRNKKSLKNYLVGYGVREKEDRERTWCIYENIPKGIKVSDKFFLTHSLNPYWPKSSGLIFVICSKLFSRP